LDLGQFDAVLNNELVFLDLAGLRLCASSLLPKIMLGTFATTAHEQRPSKNADVQVKKM
jgi:hypothetical protein